MLRSHNENSSNKDKKGRTPLYIAAIAGNLEVTEMCLNQGAQPDDGVEGITPLMNAARGGHQEIVEKLIACGANVNAGGCYATTPLSEAVLSSSENKDEVISTLIDHGANTINNVAILRLNKLNQEMRDKIKSACNQETVD